MTSTPAKPPLPAAARGTTTRYASQESVDALSVKVDKMSKILSKILSTLESHSSPPLPSPVSVSSLAPSLDVARTVYEACSRVLSDKVEYEDKEKRAVVIGQKEGSDPSDTLAADEKLVAHLVEYSDSQEVKDAWRDQKISHHRHPADRAPGSRPIKIACPSKEIRDQLLSGIRQKRGRPVPFVGTNAFIRKDLTPTQLAMEREARMEAEQKNLNAGQIVCGIRDFTVINYSTPRPLPKDYGTPRPREAHPDKNKSAAETRSGHTPTAPLSSSISASTSTPSTHLTDGSDAHVNKAPRR